MSNLLFWQDVTEYGATEDKSTDRLLRLQHAWSIYNKYLSEDSLHNIGESARLNCIINLLFWNELTRPGQKNLNK